MRERVEQSAPRRVPQPDEVAPPGFVRAELLDQPWLLVDREAVDEVDRAEQIVPRIGREDVRGLTLAAGEVVDLEPELDREPSLLRIDDRAHIAVEVVDAALEHVLLVSEPAGLHEVVDMLGEADLVDPALGGRLRPDPLGGRRGAGRVVDADHRRVASHLGDARAHGLGARLAAAYTSADLRTTELLGDEDRGLLPAGRSHDHDLVDPVRGLEALEALGKERPFAKLRERLPTVRAEPLAAARRGP